MLKRFIWFLIACSLAVLAASAYWVLSPLTMSTQTVDLSIEPQTPVRGIAQAVADAGVQVQPVVQIGRAHV